MSIKSEDSLDIAITSEPNLQGVYIDLGKTDLTSDKIKLYVRKNQGSSI